MADIQLRFNKDMLVMTSPIEWQLKRLGMTDPADRAYALLFEPEVIDELYKFEALSGAQCVVADTADLTPARLAKLGMQGDAQAMAANAIELAKSVKPQHVIVEIAPCGLPIDAASKASLVENRDQYCRVARLFDDADFDAFFLNGFTRVADLKCALMGIRKVSDAPIIASVPVDAEGVIVRCGSGRDALRGVQTYSAQAGGFVETLEDAVLAMIDLGADVVGFSTGEPTDVAVALLDRVRRVSDLPSLVQLDVYPVGFADSAGFGDSDDLDGAENSDCADQGPSETSQKDSPYADPDSMIDAADALRAAGAQFLRATGEATPAYTGALVAATDRLDVLDAALVEQPSIDFGEDIDSVAQTLRDRVSKAMGRSGASI